MEGALPYPGKNFLLTNVVESKVSGKGVVVSKMIQCKLSKFMSLCLFLVAACGGLTKKSIETGVERRAIEGGTTEILVTARASENARLKNSPAMMRQTSCRAARDMLGYELQKKEYKNLSRNFATLGYEVLERGEYCRILAHYNPRGLPRQIRSRSVDLEKIR